jgi:hypothetical protein
LFSLPFLYFIYAWPRLGKPGGFNAASYADVLKISDKFLCGGGRGLAGSGASVVPLLP